MSYRILISCVLIVSLSLVCSAAEKKSGPAMESSNLDQGVWVDIPGAPGAQMKALHAESGQAPTDLLIRVKSGVASPMHWHSSPESVYVLSGDQEYIMWKSGAKTTLHRGGFVRIPARMIHIARCTGREECVVFIHTAMPFDVHVVDENGKEIAPIGVKK